MPDKKDEDQENRGPNEDPVGTPRPSRENQNTKPQEDEKRLGQTMDPDKLK